MTPGVPPHRLIAADIRARISTGELRPGDAVPSARELTRDWGVAIATATKAHGVLRQEGLTVVRPGIGTVVAGPPTEPELTRERIVAAAVALADADGMAELSMRRVAAALDVSTMALHRYVDGRDGLTEQMIDRVTGEIALPPRPCADWRQSMEVWARCMWRLCRRHPWLAGAMSLTRPQVTPNTIRLTEWTMAALDQVRLPVNDRMHIQVLLFTFVRGVAGALEPEAAARRDSGLTYDQWQATQEQAAAAVAGEYRMPRFGKLAAAGYDFSLDSLFEFGLGRLLAGLVPYVEERGTPT